MVRGTKNVIVRQRKINVKQKDAHALKQEFCAILISAPALHRRGKPELKFFVPPIEHISLMCERATLPILNHMPQTFSLLPVFRPVLSKGAGENSAALINVASKF